MWLMGHSPGKLRQEPLESRTEAEAMEKCCLLDCSLSRCQSAFCTTQDHLPKHGTAHGGLGPPISIINLKKKNPHSHAYKPV